MSEPLQGTVSAANAIQRVKYTHDAMIDLIIGTPGISQGELAAHFGYTQAWVSRIFNSDAFQARLALRKEDVIDPVIAANMEERLRTLAALSMDTIIDKLSVTKSAELALKALDISTKALGFGARAAPAQTNQFVVMLPPKTANSEDWASNYGALKPMITVEAS
jgi:hypothetical protein